MTRYFKTLLRNSIRIRFSLSLRRYFIETNKFRLEGIRQGLSGSRVLKAFVTDNQGVQRPQIVKIGSDKDIKDEKRNLDRYVRTYLPRFPEPLDSAKSSKAGSHGALRYLCEGDQTLRDVLSEMLATPAGGPRS